MTHIKLVVEVTVLFILHTSGYEGSFEWTWAWPIASNHTRAHWFRRPITRVRSFYLKRPTTHIKLVT